MDRSDFKITSRRQLLAMPPRELHNHLMRTHTDSAAALKLKQEILDERAAIRADKIRRYQHNRLWRGLMTPLRRELSNARVGRDYRPGDSKRVAAFDAYIKVLEKLVALFDGYRLTGQTPSQLAVEKKVPNRGAHWVDWVPDSRKASIMQLFEALPETPRAKRKTPFLRTTPKAKTKQDNGVADPIEDSGEDSPPRLAVPLTADILEGESK